METVQGYRIYKQILFETGHGFALGFNPKLSDRYAVWQYTETVNEYGYYLGKYHKNAASALKDFRQRVSDYKYIYQVTEKKAQGTATAYYRYYSTQRPVDIGTFPKLSGNEPLVITNYDTDRRRPVMGGLLSAWGELVYKRPLAEKQAESYELVPAPTIC